ncbi:hypothetical protein PoB_002652000 [Plakobranchus ocellatus]|uniref:Uncharacterized protein n=1 Tax=Plakobranchus ocellatus TaxID=259542 RepID=A0AAV3ZZB9_9GAST|nr:hypothetical protein PoB_002652000 [Plakobranchus ocellatus]
MAVSRNMETVVLVIVVMVWDSEGVGNSGEGGKHGDSGVGNIGGGDCGDGLIW